LNPRVKKVKTESEYRLRLTFEDGEVRLFDMKPYLSTGIFRQLKNLSAFKSARAVMGTVQWKGGQDLCPDTLYEESAPVEGIKTLAAAREKQAGYKVSSRKLSGKR
jgi:hypothetical protein